MTRLSIAMLLTGLVLGSACGDDGAGDGTTTSGSTGPGASTGSDGGPGTTSNGPGSTGGSTTSDGTTDTGVVDDSTGTGVDTEEETDTAGIDCEAIAPGPLAVETIFDAGEVFNGSEDIAFDGQGNIAGKNGGQVRLIAPDGSEVDSWQDPGPAYGLRFRANGDLLAAKFMAGQIVAVNSGSTVANGVGGVNGLYPDFDGNVWFTNFGQVRRVNPDDSIDMIVGGGEATSSNGIVFDPDRGLLYYTNYGPGLIRAIEIAPDGTPGPIGMVASIPGAALDGLSLDACGNLYVVDQANSSLYRIFLDEFGGPVGDPEQLVEQFPTNVANAIFGVGAGWDDSSLYAAGNPGGVYRVEIGVPGAPYPTL